MNKIANKLNSALNLIKVNTTFENHVMISNIGAVIGANVSIYNADKRDGFIGPGLAGAFVGFVGASIAQAMLPVIILCGPVIIYKKLKN